MLNNTEYSRINKLLLVLIFLVTSCEKETANLNGIKSIITKRVLLDHKNAEGAFASLFEFKGIVYPLETEIHFDYKGNVTKRGQSKGEGLLFYYKNPKAKQQPLTDYKNYKIRLDTVRNLIIDNNDTIRGFNTNTKERYIYTSPDSNKRFYVYQFE